MRRPGGLGKVEAMRRPGNVVGQVGAGHRRQADRVQEQQVALATGSVKDDRQQHPVVLLHCSCIPNQTVRNIKVFRIACKPKTQNIIPTRSKFVY